MKKRSVKILALVLMVMMLVSILPAAAFAADAKTIDNVTLDGSALNVGVGNTVGEVKAPASAGFEIIGQAITSDNAPEGATTFETGETYSFVIILEPKAGHAFASNATIDVSGVDFISISTLPGYMFGEEAISDEALIFVGQFTVPSAAKSGTLIKNVSIDASALNTGANNAPGKVTATNAQNYTLSYQCVAIFGDEPGEAVLDHYSGGEYCLLQVILTPKEGYRFDTTTKFTVTGAHGGEAQSVTIATDDIQPVFKVSDGAILLEWGFFADHFKDVASSGYHDYIEYAADVGIIEGYPDSTFRPRNNVTRAQFITMLYRAEGKPATNNTKINFKDAGDISSSYTKAVAWGVESKVIAGYGDNTFRPNKNITRAEMATFMYRYITNVLGQKLDSSASVKFADANQISANFVAPVNAIVNAGIMLGINPTTFAPNSTANRGMAATVIFRVFDNYVA